jgi:hypothetical protein
MVSDRSEREGLVGFLRALQFREAIGSVALSHADDCRCLTCRAANGDDEALAELFGRLGDQL